jgi:hypothetical protein
MPLISQPSCSAISEHKLTSLFEIPDKWRTLILCVVSAISACKSSSDGGVSDAMGSLDAMGPPDSCLTNVPCAADSDCIALPGTRCNGALASPVCQKIYCGPQDSSCNDSALCKIGLTCGSPDMWDNNRGPTHGTCVTDMTIAEYCVAPCVARAALTFPSDSHYCFPSQASTLCKYVCDQYSYSLGFPGCSSSTQPWNVGFFDFNCGNFGGTGLPPGRNCRLMLSCIGNPTFVMDDCGGIPL